MQLPRDSVLLRIFIGESDRHDGRPLYEAIVLAARARGLAGATVVRGAMGFGASSHLHTARILRLSDDLPLIIEIVDTAQKVDAFLPELDGLVGGGLVTLEPIRVLHYRDGSRTAPTGA
jgi:PII-like signaling protein